MNIYVILVAALLIVMMVVFGHNPIEEARKAKASRPGDPLVNAIDDYNKKKHYSPGGLSAPGSQPIGRNPAPTNYPSYMLNNNRQNPAQPAQSGQPQSYYPPAPAGTQPSSLQQPRQAQPSPSPDQ